MKCLLDIKDAVQFLNVSEMIIRRWTNARRLKCFRIGGKRERRFYIKDLENLLRDSRDNRLKLLVLGEKRVRCCLW